MKSVQKIIFESNRLVQMRGGSLLLSDLDRRLTEMMGVERTEIAAGGQYRFRVDASEATTATADLRRAFETHTGLPGSRFVIGRAEAADPSANDFAEQRGDAYRSLETDSGPEVPAPSPDAGWLRVCEVCRSRAATSTVAAPSSDREAELSVCGVCERRQQAASQGRSRLWEQLDLGGRPSGDLSAFAADARPENYVAVVAADGDGIGQRLRTIKDDAAFSTAMRAAIEDACWAAADGGDETALPMIPQWVGGDDALLIFHPQDVFGAVSRLLQTFTTAMADRGHNGFTLSAGVAIAHASLPMHHFIAQAEELLSLAKQARRGADAAGAVGFVDFDILTEAMSEGVALRRNASTSAIAVHAQDDSAPATSLAGLVDLARRLHEEGAARRAMNRFANEEIDHGLPELEGVADVAAAGLAERLAEIYYLEGR